MKYCEDCKWYCDDNSCLAPQNRTRASEGYDLVYRVNAKPIYGHRWLTASFQRTMGPIKAFLFRSCGKSGRWFIEKEECGKDGKV